MVYDYIYMMTGEMMAILKGIKLLFYLIIMDFYGLIIGKVQSLQVPCHTKMPIY